MNKSSPLYKRLFGLFSMLFILPVFAANWPSDVDDMVKQTKSSTPAIDITTLKTAVDKSQPVLIIDVREPAEYNAGHVPGAINIPRGVLEFKIWPHVGYPDKIDRNVKIYTYCSLSGRAALSAQALRALGFNNASYVDMHFADWEQKDYPIDY